MKPEELVATRALALAEETVGRPGVTGDLVRALRAADPAFCRFVWAAGTDAGLAPETLARRAAAIFFQYLAVQISDDLSDGDCTYLADASRSGPVLVPLLQQLFFATALRAGVDDRVLAAASARLARVGVAQLAELRTKTWTLARAQKTASGLNGDQFSAYLAILWSGTQLAPRADRVGEALGLALHVASDVRDDDLRYTALAPRARRALVRSALDAVAALAEEQLPAVERVLPALRSALGAAAAPAISAGSGTRNGGEARSRPSRRRTRLRPRRGSPGSE